MASARKRKQRPEFNTNHSLSIRHEAEQAEQGLNLDQSLFIQAYEADIIRGPRASEAAESLEAFTYGAAADHPVQVRKIGDALIQWGGNQLGKPSAFPGDEDEFISNSSQATKSQDDEQNVVWVDRYDARLLIDALPVWSGSTNATHSVAGSPGGWSDIPSDSEDTFFFSPEEAEEFHREKKRRLIDRNREERLRARRIEDGESSEADDDEVWGGSEEEPDDSQRELMRRTAQHILSSPNPAQLEMRILANHGGDKKFAFLRGRWSRAWVILKGKARREKEERDKGKEDKLGSGLGILAGYGDSEDESEGGSAGSLGNTSREAPDDQRVLSEEVNQNPPDDDAIKIARRARAREWAKKRRAS